MKCFYQAEEIFILIYILQYITKTDYKHAKNLRMYGIPLK